MDLRPLYDLRERLKIAAIADTPVKQSQLKSNASLMPPSEMSCLSWL